jgi:hypothetical protein
VGEVIVSDVQILTLAMAVVVPLSLLLYSNSRITEAKETLRAETREPRAQVNAEIRELRAEIRELRAEMNAGIARIEAALKIHELEHHK